MRYVLYKIKHSRGCMKYTLVIKCERERKNERNHNDKSWQFCNLYW